MCKSNELRVMQCVWVYAWILLHVVRKVSMVGHGIVISDLDFER